MTTIGKLLDRLLPNGSNPPTKGAAASWQELPKWPPDVFAVTATLLNLSGWYGVKKFTGWEEDNIFFQGGYLDGPEGIKTVARAWGESQREQPPPEAVALLGVLHALWKTLIGAAGEDVLSEAIGVNSTPPPWADAAMKLMLMADHACAGMGFNMQGSGNPISDFYLLETQRYIEKKPPLVLKYLNNSLCAMVPSTEVCVQRVCANTSRTVLCQYIPNS